jgi:hypothetical protein
LDDFAGDDVDSVSDAIDHVIEGSTIIADGTDNIVLTDWEALVILIPFTVVPFLLVVSAIMASFDVSFRAFTCTLNWIVFPLLVLMTFFSAVMSVVTIIGASANSDFCLPGDSSNDVVATVDAQSFNFATAESSPNLTVMRILQNEGFDNTDYVFKVVSYYVQQCSSEDPFQSLREYLPDLVSANVDVWFIFGVEWNVLLTRYLCVLS